MSSHSRSRPSVRRRDVLAAGWGALLAPVARGAEKRPNILLAISDDQSFAHVSAAGDAVVRTPTFDRIAAEGARCTHAFCSSPSCTPARGAILTGQECYRLGAGVNLWSSLPAALGTYTDPLESAGYHVGHSGKGWGPGSLDASGRTRNPAGRKYASFREFRASKPEGAPFCFWFGSSDPHRPYARGSGLASGLRMDDVAVPGFLPDDPDVRGDILDYYFEIERFDRAVGGMLDLLQKSGELDSTLVLVTSDNGMPFPRAKADLYDYGSRVPLALRWPGRIPSGRVVSEPVSQVDLAPTILEAAGIDRPADMTGSSLLGLAAPGGGFAARAAGSGIILARERHTPWRAGRVGYPMRGIRTDRYLYIRNLEPDRWPAGDPPIFGEVDPSPTKNLVRERQLTPGYERFFAAAFSKRPAEELYVVEDDDFQLRNVAARPEYAQVRRDLASRLDRMLLETADPRALGQPPDWETDPHYGRLTLENRR